jgi:hypothetical protein
MVIALLGISRILFSWSSADTRKSSSKEVENVSSFFSLVITVQPAQARGNSYACAVEKIPSLSFFFFSVDIRLSLRKRRLDRRLMSTDEKKEEDTFTFPSFQKLETFSLLLHPPLPFLSYGRMKKREDSFGRRVHP